jgi:D-serine deaminase-like pyridoxal phosphate-dependent protein
VTTNEVEDTAFEAILDEPIGWRAKGFPANGRTTIRQLRNTGPAIFDGGFTTPIGTLRAGPLERNIQRMSRFCRDTGVEIAPHVKTALAPQLFAKQLAAGAWGVTVATPWQARLCAKFGVSRILLANELVDTEAAEWMARDRPGRDVAFLSYVDSPEQVERIAGGLARAGADKPIDVLLEVGWVGGRTGCRTQLAVEATVRAVAASPHHRLVGVSGFEGLIGSDSSATTLADVRAFLHRVRTIAEQLAHDGEFDATESVILTAGGSGFFDLVADELRGPLPRGKQATVVLRSGGYISGEPSPYDEVSPFTRNTGLSSPPGPLEPAIEIWTSVLSRPEPSLAILDAGKRDLPVDVGMPVPTQVRRLGTVPADVSPGWQVHATNDQHSYLGLPENESLAPGDMVSLSVVHPCTFFDKWTWIPVVNADYHVVDVIRTFF